MILDGLAVAAAQDRPVLEGIRAGPVVSASRPSAAGSARPPPRWTPAAIGARASSATALIGRADRAILQAAQRVGNLPWRCGEMADSNRRRLAYRVQALLQMCFPLAVFVYGAIVCFIAVAVLLPLTALIYRLS